MYIKNKKNHIFSFVKRHRKITKNQKLYLEKYSKYINIKYKKSFINFFSLFGRKAKNVLEIGFGMGDYLINTAIQYPEKNFIGIEVYTPGIASCLRKIHQFNIKNIRLINYDAIDVLNNMIVDNILNTIQIFFPDPWEKRKHIKRRIIQISFCNLIIKKLKKKGTVHIVTDSEEYKMHILKIMKDFFKPKNIKIKKNFKNQEKFLTKFEKKAILLKKDRWKLVFKK